MSPNHIKTGDELLLMNILPINLRGLRVVIEAIEEDKYGKVFDVRLLEEPPGRCAFHLGDMTTVYVHQLKMLSGACIRFQPANPALLDGHCLMCNLPRAAHTRG